MENCEWTRPYPDDEDTWSPSCKPKHEYEFMRLGPYYNEFDFCPFCGKPLLEKE
jgi:hypothetical protein